MLSRALIVTQYYWPEVGAPQVRYAAITRTLTGMGVHVDVLTGVPNYPSGRIHPGYSSMRPRREEHAGVRIRRLPLFPYGGTNRWLRLINHGSLASTAFAGVLMDLDPDIVVVESPPLPLVLPAAAIARRNGVPLVMYASDLWPGVPLAMGTLRQGFVADRLLDLESLCYRLAWRITLTSEGHLAHVAAHPDGGTGKVMLLPNGVDTEVFRPYRPEDCGAERARLEPLADRALFMYAGTIGHAQALDTIVDAAERLRADRRIGFVFVGDGPERANLERAAAERSLHNVVFVESVQPEAVPRYLSFARATIAPMRAGALFRSTRPAKVAPSLACAKPVILGFTGEIASMLEGARCGIAVPPEDPDALAAAVLRLTESPDEARDMGLRGRDYVLREFDFPTLIRRWWAELSAARAASQSTEASAGGQMPK